MKKLYLLFITLFSLLGGSAMALDLPQGVFSVGDMATTLETGKWYFLYNQGTKKYAKESANNLLQQTSVSPSGLSVADNLGYLVTLEDAGDGTYYIKSGRGNYYKTPGSSARGTAATGYSSWKYTITGIEGSAGHYVLNGGTYNLIAPTDGGELKGGTNSTLNSVGDWAFMSVVSTDASDLTGRDLYNYQMSKLGLIRLRNQRTSTAYLTTTEMGVAKGASKASNGLSQVWILEKNGAGYTLRSANTGQYLQSEAYGVPAGNASTIYIQFSPNNTGDNAYINISSKADFSGNTCLNLGNDGVQVTKWSYNNDQGSHWAIELAEDVTEEDVRQHMNNANGYVSELKEGAYYRLVCPLYSRVATELDGQVHSILQDDNNYYQYWTVEKSGQGWRIRNVVSERYIQVQNSTSATYLTGTNAATLYPRRTDDKWEYKWVISNTNNGGVGLHTASSQGYAVVLWNTTADASVWTFQEVELSQEDIDKARGERAVYNDIVNNLAAYQAHLDNLFADKVCTTLKSEIQALTDEQLAANEDFAALNADMKALVMKVKNDTWQQFTNTSTGFTRGYEKFFRVADYKVYSHYQQMSNENNFRMSNAFGKLSGPTGIVAQTGDIVYIYVDEEPSEDCTLQLECVKTSDVPGHNQTGSTVNLHKGLNVYMASNPMMLYIFYQLNNTQKYLANYPDMKIHIEGGQLHGYWDATRGMTNEDWALLRQALLKEDVCENLNLKTEHLVFAMNNKIVKAAEPTNIEGLMRVWNNIPVNEERYMGIEDFEGRFRNIWNCFSVRENYMYASTYGTYYHENTLSTIMNYYNMTHQGNNNEGGAMWGPSHEMGHNHQATFKLIGTTESSNNVFSNINMFDQGISTTRGAAVSEVFDNLAANTPWNGRDIWETTRMYMQLYLYFHVMGHDPQFYPNLFRALRKNPIHIGTYSNSATWEDSEGKHTGANVATGARDYLHFAKTVCDVAQADLSEFFEAYGMFVPVNNFHVGDYANYIVTTTQADIDEAKKYMQKYPKKLGNIMFIDDRIERKLANPSPMFEGVPAADGYKVNCSGGVRAVGSAGDFGDFEVFDGHTEYDTNNDYCQVSGSTITFKGEGCVGHKFYDKNGNLIWATNKKSATLPANVRNLGIENVRIVAAEENMTDSPCPYYKSGTSPVYGMQVYFGNEEDNKKWWAGTTTDLTEYLPENAIAVVTSKNASENVTSTPNVISEELTATGIVLNGDKPAYIPETVTAASVKFTKTINGYAALDLPFSVTSSDIAGLKTASYEGGVLTVTEAESVAAGSPVVVNGNVNLSMSNVAVNKGSYQELTVATVLSASGDSVEEVATASPFTFSMGEATAVKGIEAETNEKDGTSAIYDLSGRRVERVTKAGIYIVNGKKVVVK